MKNALGLAHGGFSFKKAVLEYLAKKDYQYQDFGCHSDERCDYPDYGFQAAEAVSQGKCDRGIIICKSGIGMSIVANKVKGIRAALCLDAVMARKSRQHNNANVLVLSGEFTDILSLEEILEQWLETEFEGGRHQQRLDKIKNYENKV